jgi:hypothetical protein
MEARGIERVERLCRWRRQAALSRQITRRL